MLLHFFSRRRDEERKTLFRNFIFGVEDSLVSTVGLLAGVSASDAPRLSVITSGIVLIFVEAFSMAVGSFLSEETSDQMSRQRVSRPRAAKAAWIMFISYFSAGFIPLAPYVLVDGSRAVGLSIAFALLTLMTLGMYSAKRFHGNVVSKAVEMLLLGGLATLVGIGVGSLLG